MDLGTAFGVIAVLVIYLLPLAVALQRKHRSVGAIAFVNIVLGWSVLGWLWAMIWSLTGNVHAPQQPAQAAIPEAAAPAGKAGSADDNTPILVFLVGAVIVAVLMGYMLT